jgi:hypothetical protein
MASPRTSHSFCHGGNQERVGPAVDGGAWSRPGCRSAPMSPAGQVHPADCGTFTFRSMIFALRSPGVDGQYRQRDSRKLAETANAIERNYACSSLSFFSWIRPAPAAPDGSRGLTRANRNRRASSIQSRMVCARFGAHRRLVPRRDHGPGLTQLSAAGVIGSAARSVLPRARAQDRAIRRAGPGLRLPRLGSGFSARTGGASPRARRAARSTR